MESEERQPELTDNHNSVQQAVYFGGLGGSLKKLASISWWGNALRASARFFPACLPFAMTLAAGNIATLLGLSFLESRFSSVQAEGQTLEVLNALLSGLLMFTFCLIFSLLISFWAMWKWLLRLTTYAHALQSVEGAALEREDFARSAGLVQEKHGYLKYVWLIGSAIMLVPALPLSMSISVRMANSPSYTLDGRQLFTLPPWVTQTASVAEPCLSLICFAYMLSLIAMSAGFSLPPGKMALHCLFECVRKLPLLLIITAVVLAVNIIVCAPYLLLPSAGSQTDWSKANLTVNILAQIWFGLTSSVLWTFSVAPYCAMLEKR